MITSSETVEPLEQAGPQPSLPKRERNTSSREALMKSALELLERDGILAGLNVSKVAKDVGVTPANVYHFFGYLILNLPSLSQTVSVTPSFQ